MRIQLLSVLGALLILASCQDSQLLPDPGYEANEALVDENAERYLIADIEGLPGLSKLNIQSTDTDAFFSASKGVCDPGHDGFTSSAFIDDGGNIPYWFTLSFYGKCPDCGWSDVVYGGDQLLATHETGHIGVAIGLFVNDGQYYYGTYDMSPSERSEEDEITIHAFELNEIPAPDATFKVRFNVTLKLLNSEETIHIRNGVALLESDDVQ